VDRSTAVTAGLAAFGLALASFVVLGFGRLLVGYRVALVLAAPLATLALATAVALAGLFALGRAGVGPLAADGE
jgi:tetrahydromethanopterin S-methyltransferase subunit D